MGPLRENLPAVALDFRVMLHDTCDHCFRGFGYGVEDIQPVAVGGKVSIICPSCGQANLREMQPSAANVQTAQNVQIRESAMIAPAAEKAVLPSPDPRQPVQKQILEPTPPRSTKKFKFKKKRAK